MLPPPPLSIIIIISPEEDEGFSEFPAPTSPPRGAEAPPLGQLPPLSALPLPPLLSAPHPTPLFAAPEARSSPVAPAEASKEESSGKWRGDEGQVEQRESSVPLGNPT